MSTKSVRVASCSNDEGMPLTTKRVTSSDFVKAVSTLNVQLWNSEVAAALYGSVTPLLCSSPTGDVEGAWLCPTDASGAARRTHRLLPYASPWINKRLRSAARIRVAGSLIDELMKSVTAIDLPTDPNFGEAAAFVERDIELVPRYSRVLSGRRGEDRSGSYRPKVRNHLRVAESFFKVRDGKPERFVFERAIRGQCEAAVTARTRTGMLLGASSWPTFCLEAIDSLEDCRGQVFVVRNLNSAILMHSWFDRSAPRGVPTLLVDRAMAQADCAWHTLDFDFEGSLIPSIDRFMKGFGASAEGYHQIRWVGGNQMAALPGDFG